MATKTTDNKYTLDEIEAVHDSLIIAIEKTFGNTEILNKYFEIFHGDGFDLTVYVEFMGPDGSIQSMGRYLIK